MKKWYHSKTLWVNAIAAIALLVQAVVGYEAIDIEAQAAIIVVANLVLRIITHQGLSK